MKKGRNLLVWVIFLPVLSGCAALTQYGRLERSARENYQKGNYDSAAFECAKSLKLNPDYEMAQELIKDVFKAAVNAHESRIKELRASSAKFRWDEITSEYETLSKLNQAVKDLPALRNKKTGEIISFELTDYVQDLKEAKTNAAEVHYQEGLRLSQNEGIDFQKQAAKEFKEAERFCPGYKDSASLYEKSRLAAIKRIAIIPFEDKSGREGRYGAVSEIITDEIISNIMNDPTATEFLQIISRSQLEQLIREQKLGQSGIIDDQTAVQMGKVLGLHEIVTGKITQIIYTPARTTRKVEKAEGERKVKVGDKRVWRKFYATVRIYTKRTSASVEGSYSVIDVKTAEIKKSESFTGKAEFEYEWATYTGDEDALGYDDAELVEKGEKPAPVAEEMVRQAAHKLATLMAFSLKGEEYKE